MLIKIRETGAIKELRAINNGIEWTRDLIDDGSRPHDEDGSTVMTQQDYDWWCWYIADMDADEAEMDKLIDDLLAIGVESAQDEVRDTVAEYLRCADMEDHHSSRQNAIADIRERYGLVNAAP